MTAPEEPCPAAAGEAGVNLSLGAGGVRGVAHLLVFEALEELGVPVVSITGTSIGAVLGALRASGLSGADIRAVLSGIPVKKRSLLFTLVAAGAVNLKLFDPSLKHWAPVDARALIAAFLPPTVPQRIEDLAIPFTAVATDIGREVVHDFVSGPVVDALAASSAAPGLMRTVHVDGQDYMDGAVLDPVPVRPSAIGGVPTIAVDLTGNLLAARGARDRASAAVRSTHMVLHAVAAMRLAETRPALVLRPAVQGWHTTQFHAMNDILTSLETFKETCKRAVSAVLEKPRGVA